MSEPGDAEPRPWERRDVLLSPLRYPGGKRRLAPYIAAALRLNGLRPRLFVEPFAGGASVALQLLHEGLVERIALGEKDPMVANFWRTVFGDHERLIARLRALEPTLANWEHYRRVRPRSPLGWAVKCLFLNRTSFSGILNASAGPIGGRRQVSEHTIGCRFPVERLVGRIRRIAAYADRVAFVHAGDWRETVARVQERGYRDDEALYYLDPPFYEKAERLYRHAFAEQDHQDLQDGLTRLDGNYILSYDAAPPIIARYSAHGHGPRNVELLYSATVRGKLVRASELIVSNLPRLPERTRLWRSDTPNAMIVSYEPESILAHPERSPRMPDADLERAIAGSTHPR